MESVDRMVLVRVILAHALVSPPRLALGALAGIGLALGDPRLAVTAVFLSLSRVVPEGYPLTRDVHEYLAEKSELGGIQDHGMIQPRLEQFYDWSAEELCEPGLRDPVRDGGPVYARPYENRNVWEPKRLTPRVRRLRRILPDLPVR